MLFQKKIRTAYIIIAVLMELMIALASSVYLKVNSISFLSVILTALIAIGPIVYFVIKHRADEMK
jgi:hypothetical protein